ncbi:fumarylacetoacetate hydrolase family protein [Bacillus aquiflavi]|uniref:Fumarylacetoacetate hydrolase family protein n=1 Tax=Bacillus aquiflavi TaxID=2672567 RepID=A0A6B3W172_9BACI|nr:fumarylacetoacetate hydrolase family protein [Bacillus aquiflavi]MBA4538600.1 fumarylacetoacetate hydrolase family protein [Bacillus aquiflavi]NEY82962.1 fumarylacetoacetate hydrolase family protein [Bacillus aquiflavi]
MKFVSFKNEIGLERSGLIMNDKVIDVNILTNGIVPHQMLGIIQGYHNYKPFLEQLHVEDRGVYHLNEVRLCAPLSNPISVRDFYAFEEHVKTARQRRGLNVVPEWYEMPVFYFTNHLAIIGPNESLIKPRKTHALDYELEIACIIGKEGKNIDRKVAEDYIFGYCIMNDWSARDIQMKEMKVGLGPAKGKDFATSLGPYIVTSDELEQYRIGNRFNLEMIAKVNGKLLSCGNFKNIYYSFGEMIERASEDVRLYPGDVIGSGTVGTGCILELGTEKHRWLERGDIVELEITGLGVLKNIVE